MRKLWLLLLLLLAQPAEARDWYFSYDTGGNITVASSNSNACTLLAPCVDFWGKGLSATDALASGDIVYYDAGDTWPEASNQSRIEVFSNGTSGNYIKFLPYGSGRPTLRGTTDVTGWTLCSSGCSSNTYQKTGITTDPFAFFTVTQGTDKALGRWAFTSTGGSTLDGVPGTSSTVTRATLPAGHFFFDGSTDILYVRLWGEVDPATTTVGIPQSRATGPAGNGNNGLFGVSPLNSSYGAYIWIEGFSIFGANGMGLTLSGGGHDYVYNTIVTGSGKDGGNNYYGQSNGLSSDNIWEDCVFSYNAASGSGGGQGWTTYAPRTLVVGSGSSAHHNFMAGYDWLSGFDTTSDASYGACKYCTSYDNGLWGSTRGYDMGFYVDGPHDVLIKDSVCYNAGVNTVVGTGAAYYNARNCIKLGSEHPSTDATYNIHIINNLIHTNYKHGIRTQNLPSTIDNITGIYIIGNTIVSYRGSAGSGNVAATTFSDTGADADGFVIRNNIMVARSGKDIDDYVFTDSRIDANNNLYWENGGSASSSIFNTNGTAGTSYTFTTWKAASGEDADSVMADPKFITDTEGAFDLHLYNTAAGQASTSPAVDAGMENAWTCPSWVYSQWPTYFPECAPGGQPIQGTTRSDGVADDVSTNIDIGYHYPANSGSGTGTFTSANCQHTSSTTSTNGTMVCTGTNENPWDADGKMKLTFDTDFTFNSGGTTAASCSAGCDGTLTVSSISAGVVTLARGGAATETAASTAIGISLTNVQTPSSAQITSNYGMQSLTNGSTIIDDKSDISGDAFSSAVNAVTSGSIDGTYTISGTFTISSV